MLARFATPLGCLLAAGLLFLGTPAAHAGGGKRADEDTPLAGRDREALREQLLQEMRTVRMWKLTEELKLDEATAAKVFPLLSRYDDKERELTKERAEASKELKRALDAAQPDQTDVNRLVDRVLAVRARRAALESEKAEALRKVLTPVQAGKMLLLLPKLDESFKERIKDALQKNRADKAP